MRLVATRMSFFNINSFLALIASMCLLTYAAVSTENNSTTLLSNNTDEVTAKYFSPAHGNPYLPTDDLYRPYITFQLLSQLYNNHPPISLITQNNETGIVAIRTIDIINYSELYEEESNELYSYIDMKLFSQLNALFTGTNVSNKTFENFEKGYYREIIVDSYKNATSHIASTAYKGSNPSFLMSFISLVDTLSTIVSNIYGLVTDGSSNKKHSSTQICGSYSNTVKVDGKEFGYIIYKYSKNGHGCNFAKGSDLEVVLIEAIDTKFPRGITGVCVTLFHDESRVAYAKFIMADSKMNFSDVACEAVSGWDAPGSVAGTVSA
ncbi:hypothetical protein KAFR_0F00129 [Kazachstania africana CBS 2517]|uniref:Uncharacterized protein n=1 Tax=Kazachstania africana (strain ATCC 22294 / BCRC 22015 / CBS 2517 / CECT 1963 / NBRC 1671 / NRRL Y-8276) TaxID=1071382 RepID=H2AW59_KAZAF|nr:hypothetical protein KAFR_0F00129 [Kazachstania africana CBS 2517]CCF58609.1 hypothetical protein KAFR_0F00129 [Kazachstania africana CBS 2517]